MTPFNYAASSPGSTDDFMVAQRLPHRIHRIAIPVSGSRCETAFRGSSCFESCKISLPPSSIAGEHLASSRRQGVTASIRSARSTKRTIDLNAKTRYGFKSCDCKVLLPGVGEFNKLVSAVSAAHESLSPLRIMHNL